MQNTSYPSANIAAQNILIFRLRLRLGSLGFCLRFPSCLLRLGLGSRLRRRGRLGGRAWWFHCPYFASQLIGQPVNGKTHENTKFPKNNMLYDHLSKFPSPLEQSVHGNVQLGGRHKVLLDGFPGGPEVYLWCRYFKFIDNGGSMGSTNLQHAHVYQQYLGL